MKGFTVYFPNQKWWLLAKTITIRKAELDDIKNASELQQMLWPDHTQEEMEIEMNRVITSLEGVVFLAFMRNKPVGFAECRLRKDYVEGANSSPVGYLEGIFVRPEYRRQGVAMKLFQHCERWAKKKGCFEMASDCEMQNNASIKLHSAAGFSEVNRIVCFTKTIGDDL